MPYYNNYNPQILPNNAYGAGMMNSQNGYSQTQQDPVFRWVQGRAGAEAYSLAPGTSAFLMDSNEPILYAKATDAYGRYMPLQSYKLVPMEDNSRHEALPTAEAVDYEKIRQMISEEIGKLNQNHTNNKGGK